jgi:hypothetical protein
MPATLLVGVLLTALLLVVALFILDVNGLGQQLGPGRFAVFGLLAAFAVIAVRYSSYAAGRDWFGRGDNTWVDPNELTEVRVEGDSLRLRDADQRHLRVPLRILREDPGLFKLLRQGIHRSLRDHSVQIDERARGIFIFPPGLPVGGGAAISEHDGGSSVHRS